jgi:hypothetical protein
MDVFDPICVLVCEDCGDFLVGLAEHISMFTVDEDIYVFSRCPHCQRVVKNICDIDVAEHLIEKNVKLFNWNDGDVVD